MAIDIPFGAADGLIGDAREINLSFGKLFSGGLDIYLFVQNKTERITKTVSYFASCTNWLVVPVYDYVPLEQMSVSWQEEPNIVWTSALSGLSAPEEITENGTNPNDMPPATKAECVQILGVNVQGQITVKGKESAVGIGDIKRVLEMDHINHDGSIPPYPVWSESMSIQKNRTDWQRVTKSGKGFLVKKDLKDYMRDASGDYRPPFSAGEPQHYSKSYSVTAKGDVTVTYTINVIKAS